MEVSDSHSLWLARSLIHSYTHSLTYTHSYTHSYSLTHPRPHTQSPSAHSIITISFPSSAVCLNGGTCTNINGGFMCTCPAEYTGQFCEFSDCGCPSGSQCIAVGGERRCSTVSGDSSVVITTTNVAVINNHANTITENADEQNVSNWSYSCAHNYCRYIALKQH